MARFTLLIIFFSLAVTALADNPVPYSEESIDRGSRLFQQYCTECHGKDGRSMIDVISNATDLTDPEAYYNGASREDMFYSIRNGAGVAMPSWSIQIKDEADSWNLVNFIRSLWTQEQRDNF